jgi:hypothetical protein
LKKPKVVAHKNLPAKLPIVGTMVWWMVLDKLQAPGWLWGVAGTLGVVFWAFSITALYLQDSQDIFKN